MKKLSITALLIVSLFTVTSAAQADDWSNGKFSCDLKVKELAPWWDVFNWGKWREVQLNYSLISRPESSVTFTCLRGSSDYTKFDCWLDTAFPFDRNTLDWSSRQIEGTFNPGISKSQACEAIFKAYGIRKR